jgi:hypothetical protein
MSSGFFFSFLFFRNDVFGTYSFSFLSVTTFVTIEITERSYYAINLNSITFLICDVKIKPRSKHRGQLGLTNKYYIHGTKREEATLLSS